MRRCVPEVGAVPIMPASRPRPQVARPLSGLSPASVPTMVSASSTSSNCSPKPIMSSSGLAATTANVRMMAPKMPPTSEEVNAADSARAASPRFDIGKPSSTVACELLPPGMPISTDENVSAVGVTAIMPMIIGSASDGSMPNRNGSSTAIPAAPPIAGRMPKIRPRPTPTRR